MNPITEPGIHKIPADAYHSDPCPLPSLSSSVAKVLVRESPAHAWTAHPRLDPEFEDENRQDWDLGSAAHDLLLEGNTRIVKVPASDYRTDVAKAVRDAAYLAGKVPVLAIPAKGKSHSQFEMVIRMEANVRAQLDQDPDNKIAFTQGRAEMTMIWTETIDGTVVWCRQLVDWLFDDPKGKPAYDFKTTGTSANPDTVVRWAMDQGMPFQAAWYRRGYRRLLGFEPESRFVIAENYKPFAVATVAFPPEVNRQADEQVEYAIRKWAACMRDSLWPGYPRGTLTLDVKPYFYADWETRRELVKVSEGHQRIDPELHRLVMEGFAP